MNDKKLTRADMVLLALYRAANNSVAKVPYEEIVLQAWKDFPDAYSLRNHPEHPDGSDIHKRLYQNLKANGLAKSLGDKFFRLTEGGAERARHLQNSAGARANRPSGSQERLSRSEEKIIRSAIKSRAFSTWLKGSHDDLVDFDARIFFQFGGGTPPEERKRRAKTSIDAFEKAIGLKVEHAAELKDLATFLSKTFLEM